LTTMAFVMPAPFNILGPVATGAVVAAASVAAGASVAPSAGASVTAGVPQLASSRDRITRPLKININLLFFIALLLIEYGGNTHFGVFALDSQLRRGFDFSSALEM
jgi:hypothetical protein